MGPYWYSQKSLGDHLEVYDEVRERLKIRSIAALDVTPDQRKAINREKHRMRDEKRRRARGVKPRADYLAAALSRTAPWTQLGISRRQWERRRKATNVASPCDVAGPCATSLITLRMSQGLATSSKPQDQSSAVAVVETIAIPPRKRLRQAISEQICPYPEDQQQRVAA